MDAKIMEIFDNYNQKVVFSDYLIFNRNKNGIFKSSRNFVSVTHNNNAPMKQCFVFHRICYNFVA